MLDKLDLSEDERNANEAAWVGHFNAPLDQCAYVNALRWTAGSSGHWHLMHEASAIYRLKDGNDSLVERHRRGHQRRHPPQRPGNRRPPRRSDGATVTYGDGQEIQAKKVVITLPQNVLHKLDVQPALSEGKLAPSREKTASQGVKAWIRVKGPIKPFFAYSAQDKPLSVIRTEFVGEDDAVLVGFGADANRIDVTDPEPGPGSHQGLARRPGSPRGHRTQMGRRPLRRGDLADPAPRPAHQVPRAHSRPAKAHCTSPAATPPTSGPASSTAPSKAACAPAATSTQNSKAGAAMTRHRHRTPGRIDSDRYRAVMRHLPTGVAAICSTDPVHRAQNGMIVGTFASLSMEPALVTFSVMHSSTSWPKIAEAGPSASACSPRTSSRSAGRSRRRARTSSAPLTGPNPSGAPRTSTAPWPGSTAGFEQQFTAGDHLVVIASVLDMTPGEGTPPLIFHGGRFGSFRESRPPHS